MGRRAAWWGGCFVACGAVLAACVGDDTGVPPGDAGLDATTVDASDAGPRADAPVDAPLDQNTGPAVDGGFAFASNWTTSSNTGEGAEAIAALPSGGYAIVGSYSGANATLGSYALSPFGGTRDAYVATLDTTGKVTAAVGFGGTGADNAVSVTADAAGDIYVAGYAFNGLTLNGATLAAGTFIAKLDGKNIAAAPLWTRSFGLSIPCHACLAVSGSDLDFGASFPGTIVDTTKTLVSDGSTDMMLLEMDPATGASKWAGQIGTSGNDAIAGIATDASRALYVVGSISGSALTTGQALGSSVPTGPGPGVNLLVAKLDASQTPVYAYAYGDPGGTNTSAGGIATNGAGLVVVSGGFSGGVDFGKGATGSSSGDGIVFVIDEAQHKTVWQQVIGSTGLDYLTTAAFDPWGHILVAGEYHLAPQIGSSTLPAAGSLATMIVKYSPSPAFSPEWAVGFPQLGDAGYGITTVAMAVAPTGVSIVTGGFAGTTDFGSGPVTAISTPNADTFVAGRLP